ncbi:hypothetical protein OAN22_02095 [Alphaproteobacteria bacterium]|nr:hypothetical protein [Alphaproteobacteria bacterium]
MRKRPEQNIVDKFIDGARAEDLSRTETSLKRDWPHDRHHPVPELADGSGLKFQMTFSFKEFERNSIERHVKALGVSKIEWIRQAIFKLMEEEQKHYNLPKV